MLRLRARSLVQNVPPKDADRTAGGTGGAAEERVAGQSDDNPGPYPGLPRTRPLARTCERGATPSPTAVDTLPSVTLW